MRARVRVCVRVLLSVLSSFAIILEMADCFTQLCSCQCSVSLPLVVVGWSVVCHFQGILTCLLFYVLYMQSIYNVHGCIDIPIYL